MVIGTLAEQNPESFRRLAKGDSIGGTKVTQG
jgi:hypothetical protein